MTENETGKIKRSNVKLLDHIKKLWPDGKLKKDNFLIMILLGVLLLIVVWPTGKEDDKKKNPLTASESGILDNKNDTLDLSSFREASVSEISEVSETGPPLPTGGEPEAYAVYLEQKLEAILSVMEGAGKARVMITVSASAESIVEKDIFIERQGTTEVDSAGGSRNASDIATNPETVFLSDGKGNQIPYVRKTVSPVIEGVAVVIQGGGNEKIIRHITEVIMALFGIDEHKIKIVKMIS